MSPTGGDRRRDVLLAVAPYGIFAALWLVTSRRWIVPFQDHGRELNTPLRLLSGEALYRDVGSLYGPLPPWVDATAFRLFGANLDVLVGARTVVALVGLEALRRLALRLTGTRMAASALCGFVVATTFFCFGGPAPFPYSFAALLGCVLAWWALEVALGTVSVHGTLAAGVLSGLAAGTKLEFIPAALAGPLVALLLRRPRRQALGAAFVAVSLTAAAWVVPVLLYGVETMTRHGFLVARVNPESWRRVQEGIAFGGMRSSSFLRGGWLDVLFPSLPFLAGAIVLLRFASEKGVHACALPLALGVASAAIPHNEELNVLLPASVLVVATVATRWGIRPATRDPGSVAVIAVGASMVFFLWRQPFFLRIGGYLLASAPLALLLSLGSVGALTRSSRRLAGFLVGLTVAQGLDRWDDFRGKLVERVAFERAVIEVPPEEARFLRAAASRIEELTRPGEAVAILPEPGFLLFVTGRRNPFVDEQFYPEQQDPSAVAEMLAVLGRGRVRLVLVLDRAMPEFGPSQPNGPPAFLAEVRRSFRRVGTVGIDAPPSWAGRHTVSSAALYVPRDPADPEASSRSQAATTSDSPSTFMQTLSPPQGGVSVK